MPRPLSTVSSKKSDLVDIFSGVLLSTKKWGYDTTTPISLQLIKDVIVHKSFGAAFGRFAGVKCTSIGTAIDNLASELFEYFDGPIMKKMADFDDWEKNIGEKFLFDCKSASYTFEFGKAQKIINVTMKHLYCYNVKEDYFKFCHVALDSMTYTGRSINSLNGGFYKYEVNKMATIKSWSTLTYSEYYNIQTEIREYINAGKHVYKDSTTSSILTPFKAEFYIWPRYKK